MIAFFFTTIDWISVINFSIDSDSFLYEEVNSVNMLKKWKKVCFVVVGLGAQTGFSSQLTAGFRGITRQVYNFKSLRTISRGLYFASEL